MKLIVRAILAIFVAISVTAPITASAQSEERRVSLRLYNEAAEDYREGRFDDAAEKLETAYRLYPEPILLYNLGRALEGSGDLEGALDTYQEFLEEADEEAEERPATIARIRVIEGLLENMNGGNSDDDGDEEDDDDEFIRIGEGPGDVTDAPDPPGYGLPIAIGVAGLVVAAGGIPLQLRAQSRNDESADPLTSQERASELNSQARTNAIAGISLFAAGGVLVIVSAALFVVRKNQRAEVLLSPTGAGVRVRF